MTIRQIEKHVQSNLALILTRFHFKDNYFFHLLDGMTDTRIFFSVKGIGKKIYLNLTISVRINHIEDKWFKYKNELGLEGNFIQDSFYNTFNHVDHSKYPTMEPSGIPVIEDEIWIKSIVEGIIKNNYLPFSDRLTDIKYCDKLINKDILITDETCKFSPIDGLPFRKIFIAEEAGNPKLNEIKVAMRQYCDEQYELGKKENFEKLCKIKPVFEKLFGI